MTKKTEIQQLKLLAKRFSHATRSNHRDALDAIAAELGFPHWKALTVKSGQGWMPSDDELAKVDAFVREYFPSLGGKSQFIEQSMSRPIEEPINVGEIDGHAYQIFEFSGDIRMEGEGWRILVGEADFSQPLVEIEVTHKATSPANYPSFVDKALIVAETQASLPFCAPGADRQRIAYSYVVFCLEVMGASVGHRCPSPHAVAISCAPDTVASVCCDGFDVRWIGGQMEGCGERVGTKGRISGGSRMCGDRNR